MNASSLHPGLLLGLGALLSVCVATDLRSRRIPNAVTGPAILAAIVLNCTLNGTDGLWAAFGGMALGLVILTPPFALGGIGAGDVKMMSAVGAFIGPPLLATSLVVGLMLGGVIAAMVAARQGRLKETVQRTVGMVTGAAVTRSLAPLRHAAALPNTILLPYSVPLALGTVTAVGWTMIARS